MDHEFLSCARKSKLSKGAAERKVEQFNNAAYSNSTNWRSYHCNYCSQWHITKKPLVCGACGSQVKELKAYPAFCDECRQFASTSLNPLISFLSHLYNKSMENSNGITNQKKPKKLKEDLSLDDFTESMQRGCVYILQKAKREFKNVLADRDAP